MRRLQLLGVVSVLALVRSGVIDLHHADPRDF